MRLKYKEIYKKRFGFEICLLKINITPNLTFDDSKKKKKDSINPFITKNFENIQSVKDEIDQVFTLLFQRLNTEKEILLRTINDIKDEKY